MNRLQLIDEARYRGKKKCSNCSSSSRAPMKHRNRQIQYANFRLESLHLEMIHKYTMTCWTFRFSSSSVTQERNTEFLKNTELLNKMKIEASKKS